MTTGCEETISDGSIELPYHEELIVQGFLTAGFVDTISIMRTLPPLETWSAVKAYVTDADARIYVDGKEYRYQHVGSGRYVVPSLPVEPNRTYYLVVSVDSLTVEGMATIPNGTKVTYSEKHLLLGGCSALDSSIVGSDLELAEIRFQRDSGRIYSYNGDIDFPDSTLNISPEWYLVSVENAAVERVLIATMCTTDSYYDPRYVVYLNLYEYEPAFNDFYFSLSRGADADLFFGSEIEEHPEWNISGDGFGWFFGRNSHSDTLRFE